MGVRTCWSWESAATLPSARWLKALRRPRGEERGGAYRVGRPPTACFCCFECYKRSSLGMTEGGLSYCHSRRSRAAMTSKQLSQLRQATESRCPNSFCSTQSAHVVCIQVLSLVTMQSTRHCHGQSYTRSPEAYKISRLGLKRVSKVNSSNCVDLYSAIALQKF